MRTNIATYALSVSWAMNRVWGLAAITSSTSIASRKSWQPSGSLRESFSHSWIVPAVNKRCALITVYRWKRSWMPSKAWETLSRGRRWRGQNMKVWTRMSAWKLSVIASTTTCKAWPCSSAPTISASSARSPTLGGWQIVGTMLWEPQILEEKT